MKEDMEVTIAKRRARARKQVMAAIEAAHREYPVPSAEEKDAAQ